MVLGKEEWYSTTTVFSMSKVQRRQINLTVTRCATLYPRMTIAFSPDARALFDLSMWSSPRASSGANLCS